MAFRSKPKKAPQSTGKTAPTFDFERDEVQEHEQEELPPQDQDDSMTHHANIGESVHINGELTSSEDVTVEGHIEGAITLTGGCLVVGPTGHIEGDCHARTVVVEGTVAGNVSADERVEVTPSGTLEGDITAARVVLSEGAAFRGKIDMGGNAKKPKPAKKPKKKSSPPPALDFDLPGDEPKEEVELEPETDAEPVAENAESDKDDGGSGDMLASLFDDEPAKT